MRLKNLTTSETHTQWDIAFLETYIREAMVPRSLRWEVPPQKGDPDLEGWFKHFNDSGIGLLRFLIQRKRDKLFRLDGEIKTLKDQLAPHINSEEYKEHSKGLLKILEKEDRDQKAKKRKKYTRDKQDYQSGFVFIWQKNLPHLRKKTGGWTHNHKILFLPVLRLFYLRRDKRLSTHPGGMSVLRPWGKNLKVIKID